MSLIADLRVGSRSLARRPGIIIAVVVTLGLGVGANTALFSVAEPVLLQPVSLPDAGRLVAIFPARRESAFGSWTFDDYHMLAAGNTTLSGMAAYWTTTVQWTDDKEPKDLAVSFVTHNYFSLVGVRPTLGRVFIASDSEAADADAVVVLSAALWRREFGASRTIIGRTIHLRGQAVRVIGVAPARFHGPNLAAIPDLWAPVALLPRLGIDMVSLPGRVNSTIPVFALIGRLERGATPAQAGAELEARVEHAAATGASSAAAAGSSGQAISVLRLADAVGGANRPALVRLIALVLVVVVLTLVLACTNVASLLVIRAERRTREFAVRSAVGATSGRIVRQLFLEHALLAALAAGAGLAVAQLTFGLMIGYTLPGRIALDELDLHLDARTMAVGVGLSVLTTLACGLAPVIRAARTDAMRLLRAQEQLQPASRARRTFLALQVAISLVLLVTAILFLRSVHAGLRTDLGFDPRPLAAVSVRPNFSGRHVDNIRPYYEILAEMRRMSGVTAAAAGTNIPLGPAAKRPFFAGPVSATEPGSGAGIMTGVGNVAGDYFAALGVPIVAGRAFSSVDDVPSTEHVVILNESAARALLPGLSPIGKQVHSRGFTYTVVGVARNTKYTSLSDQAVPFAFVPIAQEDFFAPVSFIVRSANPRQALTLLRRTVHDVAPELKAPDITALGPRLVAEQIDTILAPQRLGAGLLSAFALLGVFISAVGIYGMIAYAVACRTAEIGVRVALGAGAFSVISLVAADSVRAIAIGIAVGGVGCALAARLVAHLLSGLAPWDWGSLFMAAAIMLATTLVAALVPSRKALAIDPADAMRGS